MKEKILILGIAPCLEKDLAEITFGRAEEFDYIAIGLDMADRVSFPIQHMCTYHPEDIFAFKERRKAIGGNSDYIIHSHIQPGFEERQVPERLNQGVNQCWPLVDKHPLSGSSSFLGCQVAVGLGYRKIILCGCPMSGSNLINPKTSAYDGFQQGWIRYARQMFGDKVKSMSGWTKEFL